MRTVTTFAHRSEFEKARTRLESCSLAYEVIVPEPGYRRVGEPAIVIAPEARFALAERRAEDFLCAGWVDYRPARIPVPGEEPAAFEEDLFGRAAIMVLAPCVADPSKIRLIAHISGDMSEAFPYLNAEMQEGCYNPRGPTFTFMDGYRMISLYPRRIAVAKADEIVDAWRTLEMIRQRINDVWRRRRQIEPCYETREKPPALEIFKRLPRTNCRACGELTCLAFAVKVWGGEASVAECKPVFAGDHGHLKDALLEVCMGIGVVEGTRVSER